MTNQKTSSSPASSRRCRRGRCGCGGGLLLGAVVAVLLLVVRTTTLRVSAAWTLPLSSTPTASSSSRMPRATMSFTSRQQKQQPRSGYSSINKWGRVRMSSDDGSAATSAAAAAMEDDDGEPKMNPDRPELPELKGDFDWDEKFGGDDDWIVEDVPGKVVLNEVELAEQATALGKLEDRWRDKRELEAYEASKQVGFVPKAEMINGRVAMFFLVTGLLTEYWYALI